MVVAILSLITWSGIEGTASRDPWRAPPPPLPSDDAVRWMAPQPAASGAVASLRQPAAHAHVTREDAATRMRSLLDTTPEEGAHAYARADTASRGNLMSRAGMAPRMRGRVNTSRALNTWSRIPWGHRIQMRHAKLRTLQEEGSLRGLTQSDMERAQRRTRRSYADVDADVDADVNVKADVNADVNAEVAPLLRRYAHALENPTIARAFSARHNALQRSDDAATSEVVSGGRIRGGALEPQGALRVAEGMREIQGLAQAGPSHEVRVAKRSMLHQAQASPEVSPEVGKRSAVELREGVWTRDHVCAAVCAHCGRVAARRVAALCSSECLWEGHHFKACMLYFHMQKD